MTFATIVTIGIGLLAVRFLPFILIKDKEIPQKYQHILDAIPYATISLLVVYVFKDVNSSNVLATVIASALCVVSYSYNRNTILSILLSTVTYMVILQNF